MGLRLAAVLGGGAVLGIAFGPFRGLEQVFGLPNAAGYMIASFAATLCLFAVAPSRRRLDLALMVVGLGAVIVLARGLTGQVMAISDSGFGAAGVGVALLPGMIEQFRRQVRTAPYETFGSIRRRDRRRSAVRWAPLKDAAPTVITVTVRDVTHAQG